MDGVRTAEEWQAEVQRLTELITKAIAGEVEQIAELFVDTADGELFGQTEFELRELVLAAGCRAFEAVLEHRKKRGTKAAAARARTASKRPGLSTGGVER